MGTLDDFSHLRFCHLSFKIDSDFWEPRFWIPRRSNLKRDNGQEEGRKGREGWRSSSARSGSCGLARMFAWRGIEEGKGPFTLLQSEFVWFSNLVSANWNWSANINCIFDRKNVDLSERLRKNTEKRGRKLTSCARSMTMSSRKQQICTKSHANSLIT